MKKYLKVLWAVLLAAALLLVSACGGKNNPTTSTADSGTKSNDTTQSSGGGELAGTYDIKVWVAEAAVDLTKKQIDAYNASNTDGIKINATIQPVGEGEAATSMVTDVEAGGDIFCFAQDQAARLIKAGALAKLGKSAQQIVTETNDAAALAAITAGDELWAYPLTADNGYFMYYDKSVITDESHLSSLEDLIADCEKAGKLFSFELEGSAWYTASFFFGTGCVSEWITDENGDIVDARDTFNSPEGLIALKGMKKLLDSKCYNNASGAPDAFSAAIPSAIVVSGTWDYAKSKEILGDNLGVTELPSFTVDGKTYHIGSFNGFKLMGVKPQSDPVKQAVLHRLAQYLTSEECQMERFNTLAWGPTNLNAQKNEEVQKSPQLLALFAQNKYSVTQGQISGAWWDIGKAIAKNAKDATDEAGLQAALDTYTEAINGIFTIPTDEKEAFTVIGQVNGTGWDTDFEMTQKPDGTWWSNEALTFDEGAEFKVRQGKAWDVSYGTDPSDPSGSPNFVVEEAGTYFVKFVNDGETGISLEKNSPVTGWTVIGSIMGTNWDTDFDMAVEDFTGFFWSTDLMELKAGDEFKVRQGCAWDVSFGDGGANFVVEEDCKAWIIFDPAAETVELSVQ